MINIDGSFGEGGGQILRSSLALSLLTGEAVTIDGIRARRSKPGLQRQHLTAVRAAAKISNATVEGDELRSGRLVFHPGEVASGEHHFAIGTAGSATLVLQTVLPPLLLAGAFSRVVIEGGTHNIHAPPFDFLQKAYLPLIQRMGPRVEAVIERHGFYPNGGGKVVFDVHGVTSLRRLELTESGEVVDRRARALLANLPDHIGHRECKTLAAKSGWPASCFQVEQVDSPGPGNVVLIEIECENITEVFTGFGQRGVKAEHVAQRAWREASSWLKSSAPVGEHLADQLLLPLGIGAALHGQGGVFRTTALSEHSRTHIELLKTFLDLQIDVQATAPDDVTVEITPAIND